MNRNIIIFSGTTEGKNLAERLAKRGVFCHVCVATEYGSSVMQSHKNISVHEGRMKLKEMTEYIKAIRPQAVVDATHPYAVEVSANIKAACSAQGELQNDLYVRLSRNVRDFTMTDHMIVVSSPKEAALKAREFDCIFLTTGSKDLSSYQNLIAEKENVYVRVIPSEESIRLCNNAGIDGKHTIALQGPFSEEFHGAMLEQYKIDCQITKASGKTGGFTDKIAAAEKRGITTIVIAPPKDEGESYDTVYHKILALFKIDDTAIQTEGEFYAIGMGMGNAAGLTAEAKAALSKADVIFAASALSDNIKQLHLQAPIVSEYRWENISEYLLNHPEIKNAAAVFAGDIGFYSGAALLPKKLENRKLIRIPGISSMSYLAARAGISWQDAKVVSIHGRVCNWQQAVLKNKKVFMLLSGKEDMKMITKTLADDEAAWDAQVIVGYDLGSPLEEVFTVLPKEVIDREWKDGLYSLFILRKEETPAPIYTVFSDTDFIRERVPMTKEEVRHLSVVSLGLYKNAVLWDIGAGTGSVSAEAAALDDSIRIISFEKNKNAVELIQKNLRHFHLSNVKTVEGLFPEEINFENIPVPSHVFIGGTSKHCSDIFKLLAAFDTTIRIAANAVTIESVHELTEQMEKYCTDVEITQIAVSKSHTVGSYHMMKAENPIYMLKGILLPKGLR